MPGGSALYFTLAARRFCRVFPVAAVGEDGRSLLTLLADPAVDGQGLTELTGRTYRWSAVHDPDRARPLAEDQQFGVYSDWLPELAAEPRSCEILFLGSMPPQAQLAVLGQCPGAELVALDTMSDFIARDRPLLQRLLEGADVLFVNATELEALTGGEPGLQAARRLLGRGRLRVVVLKRGGGGVTLITSEEEVSVAARPVAQVVDPTGAGDSLAGGFLGRLAKFGRTDPAAMREALDDGLTCAAAAISAFGVEGLEALGVKPAEGR